MKRPTIFLFIAVVLTTLALAWPGNLAQTKKEGDAQTKTPTTELPTFDEWLKQPWHVVDAGGDSTMYYNPKSLMRTPEDTMKVWTKTVPTDKALEFVRKKIIQERTKRNLSTVGYEKFTWELILYELNCKTRKIRPLSIVNYDLDGKNLYSWSTEGGDWVDVPRESKENALVSTLCPPSDEKAQPESPPTPENKATDWTLVGTSAEGVTWYFRDRQREEQIVTAWIRTADADGSFKIAREQYDCSGARWRGGLVAFYDSKGHLVRTQSPSYGSQPQSTLRSGTAWWDEWHFIIPDTAADWTLRKLCEVAR